MTSRSAALHERARRVMPGGNSRATVFRRPHPIYAARGAGCRVTDVDGVERIDFVNNLATLIHGHAHPEIVAAATRAVSAGSCFALPTELEIGLAERLVERCPSVEHVRFASSGSEAVLMAIKAARALTGRPKVAKCERAYHGMYDHVEVSLDAPPRSAPGAPPEPVPYVDGTPAAVLADTVVLPCDDVELAGELLAAHGADLAALVLDPVPKRAGLEPLAPAFLAMARRVTRELGIVLIIDEVISFRVGRHGAQERFGIAGDLTTFGKVIGGGFPVGAIGGSASAMAVFDPLPGRPPVPHSGTFNANPVTMAAGQVALDLLDAAAFERLDDLGDRVRDGLAQALAAAGLPGYATGVASLVRLHLGHAPGQPCTVEESAALRQLSEHLLDDGILVTEDCFAALSTPMGGAEVDRLAAAAERGLQRLAASGALAER